MTWRDFFNRPMYVFGLLGALVVLWLMMNPHVAAGFFNKAMHLLMNLLAIAIFIWLIKYLCAGPKKGGKK